MTDFELYEYSENKLKEAKKRIADLEAEVNRLKLNEQLAVKNGKNLLKENAELQKKIRCECTRCVYSDSPCIHSDYGVENDEDVCPNYENVFDAYTQLKGENTELKLKLEALEGQTPWKDIKDKSEVIGKLTKAKELLKEFIFLLHNPRTALDTKTVMNKAEQFLVSEVEK